MSLFERLWSLLTNSSPGTPDAGRGAPPNRTVGSGAPTASRGAVAVVDGGDAPVDRTGEPTVKRWWVPEPEKSGKPERGPGAGAIDQHLFDALTKTLDDPEIELPRMPRVADQALLKLRESNVDYRDLAEVVQQDAALTAQVLRVANSVAYRGFAEIRNLDLAFARIGQRTLRSIILGTTVRAIAIRTGGPTRTLGEDLWRASLAAGVVCAEVAKRLGKAEDDAFLIGLLHDIGMLGVLRVCHDFAQKRGGVRITPELYYRLATDWHEHLGRRLADAWALPDPLPELIGSHHRAPQADDANAQSRHMILFADAACSLLGYGVYQPIDLLSLPSAVALGIPNSPATREWLERLPTLISERVDSF